MASTRSCCFSARRKNGAKYSLGHDFLKKHSQEARNTICSLGFLWNSIRQEWQKIGIKEQVEKIVVEYGCVVTAV